MTDAELRRRVYLETANAIRFYINAIWQEHKEDQMPDPVRVKLQNSAQAFANAAEAILESQKAGVP